MRKISIILVLLALVGGGFYLFNKDAESPEIKVEPGLSRPDPSNATFYFDNEPITLKDGFVSNPVAPGSALAQETELTERIAYGDVNEDGKNDAAVLLLQSGGGTGMFLYVATYVSGNIQYKGSNALFIGDRVSPKSISISNKVITVEYLDRKSDEPFAAEPTVLTTRSFIYKNGELTEK